MNMRTLSLCAAFLLSVAACLQAQVTVVKKGKPIGRILVEKENPVDNQAARLLQDYVCRISGATLPILTDATPRKGDVVIGGKDTEGLTEDGFRLKTNAGVVYISSGGDKGNIYGVVTLLERYLGVSYYCSNACTIEKRSTVTVPELNCAENPAFRYRQSQCYAAQEDSTYKLWMRFEDPTEVFAGGLWVHTFDKILPSSVYGESHPEYYSFINGERRPGKASQWCLSNPEVFEIVVQKVDSIFKANPGKNMLSISQNDGNFTNCTCPACRAIDEKEGALSGSVIHFLNKLAARFPDKEFSTLAYLYTMNPPKHVKPLPNVNIMLCDIDCYREVPLTDNPSGQNFMKAMKGWSDITNNIFVWDYGINFDNYVSPFPNFPIIQRNIQLFKEHHVTMHFSQISGVKGGDFSEMRAYMISKLMWNPYLDTDSLMRSFMDGYYGAAAPYIYQYEKLLEGGLLASGQRLWIYDSPVSHKDGMLNTKCRKRYNELFDLAEKAVAGDTALLKRVQLSRLPLQYADLEIARAEGGHDPEKVKAALALFDKRTREFNVPTLNERHNSPSDYCRLYTERYLPGKAKNLAKGAKIIWLQGPADKYKESGMTALTDELFGGTTFVESWIGWEGCDGSFIIDLGKETSIRSVETDFLHQLGAWILLPRKVTYQISSDNNTWQPYGEKILPEDRDGQVKFVGVKCDTPSPLTTRYIKIEIEGTKICPSWHYGVGYPAWFFIDEVTVL